MSTDWRPIEFTDVPNRPEFKRITLELLDQGITNSDEMRNAITRPQKLIVRMATGRWNGTPSDKFVNEHAWALANLVECKLIETVSAKEYRLPAITS